MDRRLFPGATRALFLCWLFVQPASAQAVDDATRGAARDLSENGVIAFQNGDYATATEKLEKAYSLLRAPIIGLWSARTFVKLGKLVEAHERYLEAARLASSQGDEKIQEQARAEARTEAELLRPRIPRVIVSIEGASAGTVSVTIDGVPLAAALVGEGRPVNPGAHSIVGVRGEERVEVHVSVAEGATQPARLMFKEAKPPADVPPPVTTAPPVTPPKPAAAAPGPGTSPQPPTPKPARSDTQRTLGWVTLGAGGLGLGVGAVAGLLAMGQQSGLEASDECDEQRRCGPAEQDNVDGYNLMRTVSSVGFIAGGVLAASGVVLVLTSPKDERQLSLRAAPGSVTVTGRF